MKKIIPIICCLFLLLANQVSHAREFTKETEYSVLILDLQGVEKINENFYVAWVEPEPSMPQLRARVLPENLEGTVKWNLTITYNRSTRNDRDTFQKQTPVSELWNITTDFGSNFYGGTATLTWTYTDSKNNSLPEQTFKFYIRGKNASVETIKSYIGDSPWFAKAIGAHESAPAQNGRLYCQFNEIGTLGPDNSNIKNHPNASSNNDGGYGIFQLTKFDVPTRRPNTNELWSWKANVDSAKGWINYIYNNIAVPHMDAQRALAEEQMGKNRVPSIPNLTYNNVTFMDPWNYPNEKNFIDAVTLKRYNGASRGHFVVWDNVNRRWRINETNNLGFNYVERICEVYE